MVDNMIDQMTWNRIQKGIFINGAAHTDSVLERLREQGVNYLAILRSRALSPRAVADFRSFYAR